MKEKRKYKFSRYLLPAFALVACAGAQTRNAESGKTSTPVQIKLPKENASGIQVMLSSTEAPDGSIVVLEARMPEALAPATSEWIADLEGAEFPLFQKVAKDPLTFQAVIAVPYAHEPADTVIRIKRKQSELSTDILAEVPLRIVDGKYKSEELKGVDNKYVSPSKKVLARINAERREIGAVYKTMTRKKHWEGAFVLPIKSPLTSPFGSKRIFNGQLKSSHLGVDLKAAVGTPITAPAGGVVALAKDLYYTGKTVILDHGYGVFTLYAHMSKLKVKKGQVVTVDQLLGLSGMTGRVTGPHLHWGANIMTFKINPTDLTQVMQ